MLPRHKAKSVGVIFIFLIHVNVQFILISIDSPSSWLQPRIQTIWIAIPFLYYAQLYKRGFISSMKSSGLILFLIGEVITGFFMHMLTLSLLEGDPEVTLHLQSCLPNTSFSHLDRSTR